MNCETAACYIAGAFIGLIIVAGIWGGLVFTIDAIRQHRAKKDFPTARTHETK